MQKNKSNSGFNKIERWVRFIRDVVLLLGIPALIVVAINPDGHPKSPTYGHLKIPHPQGTSEA